MGGSVCRSAPAPWQTTDGVVAGTNERQNVPAARALLRAQWGGGPVLFATVGSCRPVELTGARWRAVSAAAADTTSYPGLQPLLSSKLRDNDRAKGTSCLMLSVASVDQYTEQH